MLCGEWLGGRKELRGPSRRLLPSRQEVEGTQSRLVAMEMWVKRCSGNKTDGFVQEGRKDDAGFPAQDGGLRGELRSLLRDGVWGRMLSGRHKCGFGP